MSSITKQMLAQSLERLLMSRTPDQITVQMLVKECGVKRQTFYYHFHDLEDLITWMYTEQTEKLLGQNLTAATWRDALLGLLRYARSRKNIIVNTYRSAARDRLERQMTLVVEKLLQNEVLQQSRGLAVADQDRNFVLKFFASALNGVTMQWIFDGMTEEPEQLMRCLGAFTGDDIRQMLLRFAQTNTR